jgi:predicted nucleic acid-binding protein
MSAEGFVYLDSSALVKLVLSEPESPALNRFLAVRHVRASSALARVEVIRAVRTQSMLPLRKTHTLLDSLSLVALDDAILRSAATIEPLSIRSLDAIHLASALSLGPGLEALVTYDRRMDEAARFLGIARLTRRRAPLFR